MAPSLCSDQKSATGPSTRSTSCCTVTPSGAAPCGRDADDGDLVGEPRPVAQHRVDRRGRRPTVQHLAGRRQRGPAAVAGGHRRAHRDLHGRAGGHALDGAGRDRARRRRRRSAPSSSAPSTARRPAGRARARPAAAGRRPSCRRPSAAAAAGRRAGPPAATATRGRRASRARQGGGDGEPDRRHPPVHRRSARASAPDRRSRAELRHIRRSGRRAPRRRPRQARSSAPISRRPASVIEPDSDG